MSKVDYTQKTQPSSVPPKEGGPQGGVHLTQPLTPLDQSDDARDLEITQAIRKAVIADDRFSFDAKNVKIITIDGKVTLRGPVTSTDERSNLAAIAKRTPGVVAVVDQVEVSP